MWLMSVLEPFTYGFMIKALVIAALVGGVYRADGDRADFGHKGEFEYSFYAYFVRESFGN